MKLEHAIFCRKCKIYMELGAFNWENGYFEGPYIYNTTERTGSDWALRTFLENHRRHNVGFASDKEIDEVILTGLKEIQPSDIFCSTFIVAPRSADYNFDEFSKNFQKVLFIVDVYGWAWDIASKGLLKFIPEIDGEIVNLEDFKKMDFAPEDWDMVIVYPWYQRKVMERLDPRNTIVCVAGGDQVGMRREFNFNCGRFLVYGANNAEIQRSLKKLYPQKRVVLLTHGVDTEQFKPNPIPHEGFVVGWAGAMRRESKRLPLAKKIVSEMDATLKIAGRGRKGYYIPHDEMPEFFNSIDVLLITSDFEAHPLVAYESMSCGVPVVSGNVGDLAETIENGENGFLFEPENQEKGFPAALKLLRDDEELRKNMGEKAREAILRKWRWEFVANQYRSFGKIKSPEKEAPRVTVVTAVKNRVDTIRRCLDSVLAENYPNLEFIIVDGASDDGTTEILREYEKKHGYITVISESDKSQGEARNKGLQIATGGYVTFLDSDDEMINGKLGVLSSFLENDDKYFAAFGNTVFLNTDGEVTANNRKSMPSEIDFDSLNKSNYIGSGAIMLRNSPEVRFDEDKRFGEDHLLWMKLVAKYPFSYLDFDAYYWTQGSPDGIGANTLDWREISQRNKEEAMATYVSSSHREKMRIAVFCDAYGMHPHGGPAIYGYNVSEMLYRSRMDYIMFYNPEPKSHPHPDYYRREAYLYPRPNEIDVEDFNVFYVMNSRHAIHILNQKGILPIIGSNHITNSAATHCIKYLDEKQLVHNGHQVEHEKAFLKNFKGKFWFAQSRFQVGEYQRVGMDLSKTQVYLVPNPIDTDLFKRRDSFGDTIIWSGKNNWAKGIPFLKQVTHSISDRFLCLWGGEGKDFPLMPSNCVLVTGGTLFQMPQYLEQGKVFLSTSVTENQSCAVLEAMAMELPVVGFRTSGMPEIVENGETGFLVDLDDTKAMTERIKLLLDDESLRCEMGRKARKFVVDNFSYHATMDTYLDYFKKYLEE